MCGLEEANALEANALGAAVATVSLSSGYLVATAASGTAWRVGIGFSWVVRRSCPLRDRDLRASPSSLVRARAHEVLRPELMERAGQNRPRSRR